MRLRKKLNLLDDYIKIHKTEIEKLKDEFYIAIGDIKERLYILENPPMYKYGEIVYAGNGRYVTKSIVKESKIIESVPESISHLGPYYKLYKQYEWTYVLDNGKGLINQLERFITKQKPSNKSIIIIDNLP